MLKLKLQYFSHLMWRAESLKKTIMLGKTEGGRREQQGWDGWMASLTGWTSWASSRSWWRTGKTGMPQSMGLQRVGHNLATEQQPNSVSSVAQLCLTLWDPMDCRTPGFPIHHQLPEHAQTHVHWVGDAIQPSHPLSSPSPPAFNLSQHQNLFQWASSLQQVAKVLELQLQHQSFQWIFRTDFL